MDPTRGSLLPPPPPHGGGISIGWMMGFSAGVLVGLVGGICVLVMSGAAEGMGAMRTADDPAALE